MRIDLTVTPQAKTLTPSGYLTKEEAAHVIRDWNAYGNTTRRTRTEPGLSASFTSSTVNPK